MMEMATSLPPVSREQALLETYFQCLSQFAHDKAKEIVDKERDSQQRANAGTTWTQLLSCLQQLALCEKTYTSMVFLGQKWFGRKDNLRSLYSMLQADLKKVEEGWSKHHFESETMSTSKELLAHLCGQLAQFLTARSKVMDFYEQVATMGGMRMMNYDDLLIVITDITQTYQKDFHHPILSPLKSCFSLECDIISHLLQAQVDMAQLQFLSSLLHLHDANSKLNSWSAVLPVKETKKLGFVSSSKYSPALYQWLVKYKGTLVSKFSLYFHETLSKQTTSAEMKGLTARTAVDYHGKIVQFQRRSDATNISLIFDVNGLEHMYKGPGYHHPKKFTESLTGRDSYPAIFSYPGERPINHWPSIISIMSVRAMELNSCDKITYFHDEKLPATYFLSRIEPRLTFVVIFETKKSEKDSYVNNFINDICIQLRGTKLFLGLTKPGSK